MPTFLLQCILNFFILGPGYCWEKNKDTCQGLQFKWGWALNQRVVAHGYLITSGHIRYLGIKSRTVCYLLLSVPIWISVPRVKSTVQMVERSLGTNLYKKRSCWLPSVFWQNEGMADFSRESNVLKGPENPEWQWDIFRFSSMWKSSASPTRLVLTTNQSQNSLQSGIVPIGHLPVLLHLRHRF